MYSESSSSPPATRPSTAQSSHQSLQNKETELGRRGVKKYSVKQASPSVSPSIGVRVLVHVPVRVAPVVTIGNSGRVVGHVARGAILPR